MIALLVILSGLFYSITPISQQRQLDAKCRKHWEYCKAAADLEARNK